MAVNMGGSGCQLISNRSDYVLMTVLQCFAVTDIHCNNLKMLQSGFRFHNQEQEVIVIEKM